MTEKIRKYTQIRDELDEVLDQLQSVDTDVDKALDLHAKGTELVNELRRYLENAKNEVKKFKG
ncbi:MAG TPA: exodeoxyribonuclease VII small subunit [Candidatus Saccharibacteria bacterium]|nr:exodeoxyribonuclease VII small subunit [Candidatus Saccharibacteria bacterium]